MSEFTTASSDVWAQQIMTSNKAKATKPTAEKVAPKKKASVKAVASPKPPDNYAARQAELARLSVVSGQKPEARALFPKITLSAAEFDVIASLIRSRDPSKSAARLVLVDGLSMSQAAKSTLNEAGKALSSQMVNNTVTRFKAAHTLICEAYASKS